MLLDAYLHFLKAGLLKFLKNTTSRLEDIFLNFLCRIHLGSWSEAAPGNSISAVFVLYLPCINFSKGSFNVPQNKCRVLKDQSEDTLNYFHNVIALKFALSLLELQKLTTMSHTKKLSKMPKNILLVKPIFCTKQKSKKDINIRVFSANHYASLSISLGGIREDPSI